MDYNDLMGHYWVIGIFSKLMISVFASYAAFKRFRPTHDISVKNQTRSEFEKYSNPLVAAPRWHGQIHN